MEIVQRPRETFYPSVQNVGRQAAESMGPIYGISPRIWEAGIPFAGPRRPVLQHGHGRLDVESIPVDKAYPGEGRIKRASFPAARSRGQHAGRTLDRKDLQRTKHLWRGKRSR
jgi:hypothetical protein